MKYLIWKSEIDVKDYKDLLNEEYPEITDEYEQYRVCWEYNQDVLEDEKANLGHIIFAHPIIQIAELGLWFGKRTSYKVIGDDRGSKLTDIFSSCCGDDQEYYVEDGDACCDDYHHDGMNHYIYRELRCDEECAEDLLDALYSQKPVDQKLIEKYTKSIAPEICKVYGWKSAVA